MTGTPQLPRSLPTDWTEDRRNFRSSPVYRGRHDRAETYGELCRYARLQDRWAIDGFARRATERLRMQRELRRLADAAYTSGFPKVLR